MHKEDLSPRSKKNNEKNSEILKEDRGESRKAAGMEKDTVKPHRRSENGTINPKNDKVHELDDEMETEINVKII